MAQSALIVIDVQQSFLHRPYFDASEVPAFLAQTRALIAGFKERQLPVISILHSEPDGVFSIESGLVRTMDELSYSPDASFTKTVHSALAGTGLNAWLIRQKLSRLTICGIRTEQCCETTTRHASDMGFEVDYVTDATLTFPMRHADGTSYSTAQIRQHTETVLSGRFATICDVESALQRAC